MIDLAHEIAPFDVRAGSLALARCIGYLSSGVVLAVVDPGVATDRRAVAIEVAGGAGVVIGPDNGLLAPAVAMAGGAERACQLANPAYQLEAAGATFAGSRRVRPGRRTRLQWHRCSPISVPRTPGAAAAGTVPLPRHDGEALVTKVLWVDRFGNAQLNVGPDDLPAAWGAHLQVQVGAQPYRACSSVRRRPCVQLRRAVRRAVGLIADSSDLAVAIDDAQPLRNSALRPTSRSRSCHSTILRRSSPRSSCGAADA